MNFVELSLPQSTASISRGRGGRGCRRAGGRGRSSGPGRQNRLIQEVCQDPVKESEAAIEENVGVCDNDDPTNDDDDAALLQIFQDIRLEDKSCIEVIDSDNEEGAIAPDSEYTPSYRPESPMMDDVEAVEEPAAIVTVPPEDQDVEAPSMPSNLYLLPWEEPTWPAFASQTTKEPDHKEHIIPKSARARTYDDDTTLRTLLEDARQNLPSSSSSAISAAVPREPTPGPPLNVPKASNRTRIRGSASMYDPSTKWVGNWSFVLRRDMEVPWRSIPSLVLFNIHCVTLPFSYVVLCLVIHTYLHTVTYRHTYIHTYIHGWRSKFLV